MNGQNVGALSGYRVLDLCDERGLFCGRILADLGADVLQVEPPQGSPARLMGPFYHDDPSPEKSLFWFAYAGNKRSVTLDLTRPEGQNLLLRLIPTAHFLIESFGPGYMDSLGLGYSSLSQANPGLIMASISAFGEGGPYQDFQADDIVLQAMGGLMYVTGEQERPPLRVSFPQAYDNAAGEAAVGSLLAHHYRGLTGRGQHVDVSAQQAMVWTLMDAQQTWDINRVIPKRTGAYRVRGSTGVRLRTLWQCQDGWISYALHGGVMGERSNQRLATWMGEEGAAPQFLIAYDWKGFDWATVTQEEADRLYAPISHFFMAHTKDALYAGAKRRGILLYPVLSIAELAASPQLAARGFFVPVEHPELGTAVRYPGPFARLTETPLTPRRRAPLIGEHNQEVYCGELGLSLRDLAALKYAGVI